MSEILVLSDGAKRPKNTQNPDETIELRTVGTDPNVRVQISAFRTKFLQDLPERLDDLIRIATLVYATDTRVGRGTEKDVFGASWSRDFRIAIPVWDLDFWTKATTRQSLEQTLNFLTGDKFQFSFEQRKGKQSEQLLLQFQDVDEVSKGNVVVAFSGGSDSLAAVLSCLKEDKKPILVSHRAAPQINRRQKDLVESLSSRFPTCRFPHLSLWVHRTTGNRAIEFTQRSRAFLFASLSAVTASLLNIDDIRLCDNGPVSINLPQSSQNVGTLLSRSTHPKFLTLVESFSRLVTERPAISVTNSLLFKTKKEVVEIIHASGYPELLQETVSCAHVEGMTRMQPHCGVCTQCIDRRFATVAAGLEEHDLASKYRTDIFLDELKEGRDRTHAENYVRFATKLEQLPSSDALFEAYPEVYDCLPSEGDVDAFANEVWKLFERHQKTVNGVVERQLSRHVQMIRQGTLPRTCLLQLVATGQSNIDERIKYIERLSSLVCTSIPAAFQTVSAKSEKHVQDVCESVLMGAREKLNRESPQIPFGIITTKPDFSQCPPYATPLFVEFKFSKERKRLNGMITEMTSRVTIYRKQGAWILFVVYDPNRVISDDDKFRNDFEAHEGVWVGTAR